MKNYQHFATVLTGLLGTDMAVRLTVAFSSQPDP